jgi:hypothetical protein
LFGAKSLRKFFGKYGGDDGARTRDLCRDRIDESAMLNQGLRVLQFDSQTHDAIKGSFLVRCQTRQSLKVFRSELHRPKSDSALAEPITHSDCLNSGHARSPIQCHSSRSRLVPICRPVSADRLAHDSRLTVTGQMRSLRLCGRFRSSVCRNSLGRTIGDHKRYSVPISIRRAQ